MVGMILSKICLCVLAGIMDLSELVDELERALLSERFNDDYIAHG